MEQASVGADGEGVGAAEGSVQVWTLFYVFTAASLWDAFLTFFALTFVPGASELNPVLRQALIAPLGPVGVWVGKFVLIAVTGALVWAVLRWCAARAPPEAVRGRRLVASALLACALAQSAIGASNLLLVAVR